MNEKEKICELIKICEEAKLSEDLIDLVTYGVNLKPDEFEDYIRLLVYFVSEEPFNSCLKKLALKLKVEMI